jgi:hypothetical protein
MLTRQNDRFRTLIRARSKTGECGTKPGRNFPVVVVIPFEGPIQKGGKWDVRVQRFSMTQAAFIACCRADLEAAQEYLRDEVYA